MKTNNSALVYEGRSEFDNQPIVAIATGFNGTANDKLGQNVVQVWVLRGDINPVEAVKSKQDRSICGSCPLRQKVCYVNRAFAPQNIYKTYANGGYKPVSPDQLSKMVKYQKVLRLTAYGDLGAIPSLESFEPLIESAKATLGYTHAWGLRSDLKGKFMASVSTVKTALIARAKGWHTFRTKRADEPLLPGEIHCPNQIDPSVQCEDCRLCDGNTTSVVINVHGLDWKKKHFQELFI